MIPGVTFKVDTVTFPSAGGIGFDDHFGRAGHNYLTFAPGSILAYTAEPSRFRIGLLLTNGVAVVLELPTDGERHEIWTEFAEALDAFINNKELSRADG